jgi:hypothetical protein
VESTSAAAESRRWRLAGLLVGCLLLYKQVIIFRLGRRNSLVVTFSLTHKLRTTQIKKKHTNTYIGICASFLSFFFILLFYRTFSDQKNEKKSRISIERGFFPIFLKYIFYRYIYI